MSSQPGDSNELIQRQERRDIKPVNLKESEEWNVEKQRKDSRVRHASQGSKGTHRAG